MFETKESRLCSVVTRESQDVKKRLCDMHTCRNSLHVYLVITISDIAPGGTFSP